MTMDADEVEAAYREVPDYVKEILAQSSPDLHRALSHLNDVADEARREAITCVLGSCAAAGSLAGYDSFFDAHTPATVDDHPNPAVCRVGALTGHPACAEHSAGRKTYPLWPERKRS